jgi:integrase
LSYPERRYGRATGRWVGEVRHRNGRFRNATFKSKEVADAYEAHVRAYGEEPEWARRVGDTAKDSFASVLEELESLGGPEGVWAQKRDPSGLRRRAWVKGSKIGQTPINLVNRPLIDKVILTELGAKPGRTKGQTLKPATINKYLSVISATLTFAEDSGLIENQPKLPWRKVAKFHQPVYTPEHRAAVIAELNRREWCVEAFVFELMEFTGFRRGEILNLKPENILDGEFLVLTDVMAVKTENSLRMACIGRNYAARLAALITDRKLPVGSKFYYRLKTAVKSCGITMPRPSHACRHTFATRTVNSGIHLKEAQVLLGHGDISTTADYMHPTLDALRSVAKNLARQRGIMLDVPEVAV